MHLMKLEESIVQQHFKSQQHKATVNLLYTGYYIKQIIRKMLEPYDVTEQQYNILRILKGQYPNAARISLVKERMLDKSCDASRLIERLRIKGLVKRKEDGVDRRAAAVTITKKGLTLLEKIGEKIDFEKMLFNETSEEDFLILNELLDKIRKE